MKKRLKIVATLLSIATLFAGCGEKYYTLDPVEISIWTYYNGEQLTAFNELVDIFNETVGKEQGIVVENTSQGDVNELAANVEASALGKVGSKELPNIFAAYADCAYSMDKLGIVADLSDYITDEERDLYIDSYLDEGRFSGGRSIKIFPVAKSTEILMMNKTDWDVFASEAGATYEDLSTIEGVVRTAEKYYNWTDAKTSEPNDGKAFFGRDSLANYFIIGSMQFGNELFTTDASGTNLWFNKDTIRKLWDNYYVPFIKGYFTASGRFRSDDVKMGNVLAYVGSTSSASFFPKQVTKDDIDVYDIESVALSCPIFEDGASYAVQQGAGMVVTKGTEEEIEACITFLKWFTKEEQNIEFSVKTGYLPVTKGGNNIDTILDYCGDEISVDMRQVLEVSVDTINTRTLYTNKPFDDDGTVRDILENTMSDVAVADRMQVEEYLKAGMTLEEATAQFLTDDYFESWYENTLSQLNVALGK